MNLLELSIIVHLSWSARLEVFSTIVSSRHGQEPGFIGRGTVRCVFSRGILSIRTVPMVSFENGENKIALQQAYATLSGKIRVKLGRFFYSPGFNDPFNPLTPPSQASILATDAGLGETGAMATAFVDNAEVNLFLPFDSTRASVEAKFSRGKYLVGGYFSDGKTAIFAGYYGPVEFKATFESVRGKGLALMSIAMPLNVTARPAIARFYLALSPSDMTVAPIFPAQGSFVGVEISSATVFDRFRAMAVRTFNRDSWLGLVDYRLGLSDGVTFMTGFFNVSAGSIFYRGFYLGVSLIPQNNADRRHF